MYVDFCANISKMVIAKEEKILEKIETRNDRIAWKLKVSTGATGFLILRICDGVYLKDII